MQVVVMGVCGSGKTRVGAQLAKMLDWLFEEGDEWHPETNVDKMTRGIPLSDEDRRPWLEALHSVIAGWAREGKQGVLTCSALKQKYRDILTGRGTDQDVSRSCVFVVLVGNQAVLEKRMQLRGGHFMPPSLLHSQLETLEVPTSVECRHILCNCSDTVDRIVEQVMQELALPTPGQTTS